MPIQTLPTSKKKDKWKKNMMDFLEREGLEQVYKNAMFREARKMIEGTFTYSAVDVESNLELATFKREMQKLRKDGDVPLYLKHFDFMGIIVNAIVGIFDGYDDRYKVESIDEYSTNEFIRAKTEKLHEYARSVFKEEIDRMLMSRGIDPNKADFQSEEEAQAYQAKVQENVKALTPQEIEKQLSKNFKVLATEWAQNVLTADKKRFYLDEEDRESLIDFILTGRFFRHFRIGYDSYSVERWSVEETFFSQDVDARYPQFGDYVGRITSMSTSKVLQNFGHILSFEDQKKLGNYFNQSEEYDDNEKYGGSFQDNIFPKQRIVPFHNYYDHQINLQMESALGVPLGEKLVMDENGNQKVKRVPLPRQDNDYAGFNTGVFSKYMRDDIDVRLDTVRVTEAYFRSQKRLSILVYENKLGTVSVDIVTEELLPDFLKENDIKQLRKTSIEELRDALRKGDFSDYVNTITHHFVPECWYGVKIKGNATTLKEDLYIKVQPTELQIKGDSNYFDVQLPVGGIISTGIVSKILPWQQLYNVSLNQLTEFLEKELGVFFTFDITALAESYKDEDTTEALFNARAAIKDTALFGVDMSRQNTQGNNPNVFARQDLSLTGQIQMRQALAQFYQQKGYEQVGITPQMLGQPNTYVTAEGVKQNAQATYSLLNTMYEKFNAAKARCMELHLAVAQFCEMTGRENSMMFRKGDGELSFINIMKEDPIMPLRKLSIVPLTSNKESKIVESIKQIVMNDNTIEKDIFDVVEIMTNPVLLELKQAAKDMRDRTDRKQQERQQFESEQLDKQIQAQQEQLAQEREHETNIVALKGEYSLKEKYLDNVARMADKNIEPDSLNMLEDASKEVFNQEIQSRNLDLKEQDLNRKADKDNFDKKIALENLKMQTEKLRQKNRETLNNRYIATINKN
jgi:hypothetical protein